MVLRSGFALHSLDWRASYGRMYATTLAGLRRTPFRKRRFSHLAKMFSGVLLVSLALAACAQREIVTVANWRVHAGDNPAWARPDFDDSQWAGISYGQWDEFGPSSAGTHWYRATFKVPADFAGQELAVGLGPLQQVYDVYIDGALVGRFGNWNPGPQAPFPRHLAFAIPPNLLKGPVGHIAIRRWESASYIMWIPFSASGYFSFPHPPEIGSKLTIQALERLHPTAGAIRDLPWDLTYVLLLFAGFISFVLFSAQKRRAEYFYLGLYCTLAGATPFAGIPLATSSSVMAQSWGPVLVFFFDILAPAFSLLFLACLCPRFRRILQIGAALALIFALAAAYSLGKQSYAATELWEVGFTYGVAAFELVAMVGLLLDRRRGSFAIALCLLLNAAGWAWGALAPQLRLPLRFEAGPFGFDLRSFPSILFVFVTLLVLYLRYRDEQARQAAIDQDMAAAQRMQNQLLAGGDKNATGFTVDAVYRPAREVGGDFYRTVSLEDGSLLVIVGDVSGKGLDAAMLVALVLGSLANETHRSPAALLAYLNRAVMGRTAGGFVTACCARFYADGRVVLANAGQIAPYVNGREVQLENGLPLGISADATYSEMQMHTAETMTFVSDGVVEARNARGQLLGFERMAALTTKRAEDIAEAAQRWGQEDDITVLSVTRAPALEPATA